MADIRQPFYRPLALGHNKPVKANTGYGVSVKVSSPPLERRVFQSSSHTQINTQTDRQTLPDDGFGPKPNIIPLSSLSLWNNVFTNTHAERHTDKFQVDRFVQKVDTDLNIQCRSDKRNFYLSIHFQRYCVRSSTHRQIRQTKSLLADVVQEFIQIYTFQFKGHLPNLILYLVSI